MKFTSKLIDGLMPLSRAFVATGNRWSPPLQAETVSPHLNASERRDRHKLSKRKIIKERVTEEIKRGVVDSDHSVRRKGHMLGLDRCKCQLDSLD